MTQSSETTGEVVSRAGASSGKQGFDTPPVLITGMSGSGLSSAARVFEDKGFYVAHNIPAKILVDLVQLCAAPDSPVDKLGIVADVRTRMFPGSLTETINELDQRGMKPTVLFMDARDDVLIRRFDSVRRTHPLQGTDTLIDGISREREAVEAVRAKSDIVIDTSALSVHDLRRAIEASFGSMAAHTQHVTIESFGFKHGAPRDADLMLDVRFLPNPFWIPELRGFRGVDEPVSDYVLGQPSAEEFTDNFLSMFDAMLAGYRHEGKNFITVAIGCTGGHHRSVAIAEAIAARLKRNEDIDVSVRHRDIEKN